MAVKVKGWHALVTLALLCVAWEAQASAPAPASHVMPVPLLSQPLPLLPPLARDSIRQTLFPVVLHREFKTRLMPDVAQAVAIFQHPVVTESPHLAAAPMPYVQTYTAQNETLGEALAQVATATGYTAVYLHASDRALPIAWIPQRSLPLSRWLAIVASQAGLEIAVAPDSHTIMVLGAIP